MRTNSGSDGTRDRKSKSSLLPTAFGFRIFLVNLLIPEKTWQYSINWQAKYDY